MELSFYVHIPYCVKRCGYCDFNTYTPAELQISTSLAQISNSYIDLLINEIDLAKAKVGQASVPTIFFGGGTPSLMEPVDIARVIMAIDNKFGITNDCEITLETNPDVILGNDFARVGILKNPTIPNSNVEVLNTSMVSGLQSLKLSGVTTNTTYAVDSIIKQTVGLGSTAIGFVASWDNVTGVLKYYQPTGLASSETGFKITSIFPSIALFFVAILSPD